MKNLQLLPPFRVGGHPLHSIFLSVFFLYAFFVAAQENTPSWSSNYPQALAQATEQNKALALLQFAPDSNRQAEILSHPLLVEVLENSFIPVQIEMPANTEAVVRILDAKGKDLVPSIGAEFSPLVLCQQLKKSLAIKKEPIPLYLRLLEQELSAEKAQSKTTSYFKMFCFWSGEKQLGKQAGVLDVEAGFAGGSEVVKVTYDSRLVDNSTLVNYAQQNNFAPMAAPKAYRIATNDKRYYLKHSYYKYLPLSELQKTKINSALGSRQEADHYLSPQQKKWLTALVNKRLKAPVLYQKSIQEGWGEMGE